MLPDRTILVICESFGTGEHIAGLLEDLDRPVRVISTRQGLDSLSLQPAVVVLEDSAEITTEETREKFGDAPPLIYLQGEESLSRIRHNAARADHLLAKPFSRRGVVGAVLSVLESGSPQRETGGGELDEFAGRLSRPLTVQVLLVEHLLELAEEAGESEADIAPLLEQLKRTTREMGELLDGVQPGSRGEGEAESPLSLPRDRSKNRELLG